MPRSLIGGLDVLAVDVANALWRLIELSLTGGTDVAAIPTHRKPAHEPKARP